MLRIRGRPFGRSQNSRRTHHAIVPARTSFPALWQDLGFLLLGSNLLRPVDRAVIHMRRRMTASLRATATLALRSPLRLTSFTPQAFTADPFGTRVSRTPLSLRIDNCAAWHYCIGEATSPIDLSTRGVCRLTRHRRPRFWIARTCRIVNRCLEGERGDRPPQASS